MPKGSLDFTGRLRGLKEPVGAKNTIKYIVIHIAINYKFKPKFL